MRYICARMGTRNFFIRHSAFFMLVLFIVLCLINNLALPLFEASDEASHFRYANYLATAQRLPDLNQDLPSHEATQPVLYYALVALVIRPFDRSALDPIDKLNPDWFDKGLNADYKSIKNLQLHGEAEQWPWSGVVWAMHVARFVSSLLGALVVGFVFLIARRGGPDSAVHASLAAALVAFNPKFIHISSIVSNDIAITLVATVACWWMVRLAQRPKFIAHRRGWLVLGGLCGLAVLCKLSGMGLLAAVAVLAWIGERGVGEKGSRRNAMRTVSQPLFMFVVGFVGIAGWWFALNMLNYSNPLAWEQVRAANAALLRTPPLTLGEIFAAFPRVLESFWGVVGIELDFPRWVHIIFFVGLVLAIAGCVKRLGIRDWRWMPRQSLISYPQSHWLVLAAWVVALLALFIVWLRGYVGTENGRLIMPGVAPLAIAVAAGWLAWVPKRWHRLVAFTSTGTLFALALATPFWVIRPAFAEPTFLSKQHVAALPNSTGRIFGGEVKLLHATLVQRSIKPGEAVQVSLFWGATQSIPQSYRVLIEALDLNGDVIGRTRAIPFAGRFATQRWPVNQFFQDDYEIKINADAKRGAAAIKLSLMAPYPEAHLLTIDGSDDHALEIGKIKIDASVETRRLVTARQLVTAGRLITADGASLQMNGIAIFGGQIALDSVDVANSLFTWRCVKQPDKDYTLFIHILDAQNKLIWQSDGQPLGGRYPTRLWDGADVIEDKRQINFQNAQRVLIGWYDAQTGERLAALRPDGTRWQDDAVSIWSRDRAESP